MYEELNEEASEHGLSFSAYLQEVVRDHDVTPFEEVDHPVVCVDENGQIEENGSADESEGAA